MDETHHTNQLGRDAFATFEMLCQKNCFKEDTDYQHTLHFVFGDEYRTHFPSWESFGALVTTTLEALVAENNLPNHLPEFRPYDAVGNRIDEVVHHPTYVAAGDIIYGSKLMAKLLEPNGLLKCLSYLFLSAETGEAGHNCPIACSAGIIRVLQKMDDFPEKNTLLQKLTAPSFQENFTGAQFLTEIQGGSDVGLNATRARLENGIWKIDGEKWFCSNANADLIFITARYDENIAGTKGLALFLVPAKWEGKKNHYTLRRLKEKIGTRSMATAEIDFHGANALLIGDLQEGFYVVMDNVLHLSRLFNAICVLGMARRAYFIARYYASCRIAFGHPIIDYPLVSEKLARIKSDNTALLAGVMATIKLQDEVDQQEKPEKEKKLLLRLLVNLQKYLTALLSVEHIHHALDTLAGNGTIETFSAIPRLLRDAIVCENWEGAHNVIMMQIHRDILKYQIDDIFCDYITQKILSMKEHPCKIILKNDFLDLKKGLQEFKKLSDAVQALQIKKLVNKMGLLHAAVMLFFEASDQEETEKALSKQYCLQYFCLLHMEKNIQYNEEYLQLIQRIVN